MNMIITTLEDTRITNKNIYLAYIDFQYAFGSIDHAWLLAIMKDLGHPQDAVELVRNIYTNSTTSIFGNQFGMTYVGQVSRDIIQEIH